MKITFWIQVSATKQEESEILSGLNKFVNWIDDVSRKKKHIKKLDL